MTPLHVFLDTSVLSRTGRREGAAFQALRRLAHRGELTLHFSSVTVGELTSQDEIFAADALSSMRKGLRDIERRFSSGGLTELATIQRALERLGSELTAAAQSSVPQWISQLNGRVHSPQSTHATAVLDFVRSTLDHAVRTGLEKGLLDKTVESADIPGDNGQARVLAVIEARDVTYKTKEAEYYGDGCIWLPFEASVEILASYSIFKGDYYVLTGRRSGGISTSELNEHYFDAEETLLVWVTGAVSVFVDEAAIGIRELHGARAAAVLASSHSEFDEIENIDVLHTSEELS